MPSDQSKVNVQKNYTVIEPLMQRYDHLRNRGLPRKRKCGYFPRLAEGNIHNFTTRLAEF